jgi:hypothetical protein
MVYFQLLCHAYIYNEIDGEDYYWNFQRREWQPMQAQQTCRPTGKQLKEAREWMKDKLMSRMWVRQVTTADYEV